MSVKVNHGGKTMVRCVCTAMLVLLASCGGGGGGGGGSVSTADVTANGAPVEVAPPPAPENVIPISVALGLASVGQYFPNQSFVSVRLCEPGRSNCVTVDRVLVDSGSYGLRVFDTALSSLQLSSSSYQGNSLYQCAVFASGYTQGPVTLVDLKLGQLSADQLPIQVIQSGPFPVPRACSQSGTPVIQSPNQMGANGILGVGPLGDDSGPLQVYYYVMQAGQASVISTVPSALRVPQPISRLNRHHNGLILSYPPADPWGSERLNAQMILGLDTASNNASRGATFFSVNHAGRLKVTFNGQAYNGLIDSGANHVVLPMPYWPNCPNFDFFCPSAPETFNIGVSSYTGPPSFMSTFTVVDFNTYGGLPVQPGLAGYTSGNTEFILGLPFMYGRKTYIAIQGQSTPGVNSPAVGLSP